MADVNQWNIDVDALKSADRHYYETLALPDLRGFTDGLISATKDAAPLITDDVFREIYVDMVREIQDLLRDIRFCTGVGMMLLLDAGRERRTNPLPAVPSMPPGLFLSEADLAVLLTNAEALPPSALAIDRHQHVGERQSGSS